MGRDPFTRYDYQTATSSYGISSSSSHVTRHAEERVRKTGKLDPAVDPAVNPIRRSLIRFDPTNDGRWEVTVGCPIPVETAGDTTGSMGNNVDKAMHALPDTYELMSEMLPGCDLQLAQGIFGDCDSDQFPLNRPQFEMNAKKIVDYLAKMNPERRGGGNGGEDPQYAAFAAAYLTDAYINKIGLKGYHFIYTDEPYHRSLTRYELTRIFGDEIWNELAANGYGEITASNLPDVQDVFIDLGKKFHSFVLVMEDETDNAYDSWRRTYHERAIRIRTCADLPAVMAAIVGYTEGVLQPVDVKDYLTKHEVDHADNIAKSISKLEFAAQRKLEEEAGYKLPKAGDIFANKTDLQPDTSEKPTDDDDSKEAWL